MIRNKETERRIAIYIAGMITTLIIEAIYMGIIK